MSTIAAEDELSSGIEVVGYSRFQPWIVCLVASLFFFFEFIQLNIFNAIGPSLTQAFHIDGRILATISDKYFLANILFLFPAGMILDRVSTRKIILIGLLVSVLCTYGFAIAHSVWEMKLYRFITGVAGSFCFLSAVRLTSRWFEPKRMALVVGLVVTLAMVGGMVAQTPLAILIKLLGWRRTIMIDASSGVLMVLLVWWFVKDFPSHTAKSDGSHSALKSKELWQTLRSTLVKPQNWLGGLYTSLMNLPIFLLGAIWGIFYLTQSRHLSNADASIVTSMLFVGVIIGSPAIGWFSDAIRRRKLPMILGAILSLVFILMIIYIPSLSFIELAALFFAIGFVTSAQVLSYPLIVESNHLSLTATAEGMASVLIMAGGFSQLLFAYLMQLNWTHQYLHGVPFYSLQNYRIGLVIMPIAFVISLLVAFFVKETRCEPYREKV